MLKANCDVDMVITDINMPRMDGLLLLQNLQESEEKLSTIIVSAYGDMANIRTAMNRGAFDFLTKPIDFLDLETTIAKTIRHIEVLREARRRQAEAERAHATLSRYFSPNLAERLASDADAIDLGGQRREIATLFTDIASFTALVETLEPDALGPLLNDYLTGMTDLVFSYDGTVAKIVGDALHVLFGAPGAAASVENDPIRAMRLDLSTLKNSLAGKWLGLLKELAPQISRVSVLFNPKTQPRSAYYLKLLEAAALSLTLKLKVVQVGNAGEIEAEIDQLAQQSNAGLVVLPDIFPAAQPQRDLIVARTAQHRIPAVYPIACFARAGGLVSYGINTPDLQHRAAGYVDRILKGAKPQDLPVQLPTNSSLSSISRPRRRSVSPCPRRCLWPPTR